MLVSCNMPNKVRVGRSVLSSFLFNFFFVKEDFVGKIGGKIRFAKKMVKNCENSVFRVIYVKKRRKSRIGAISLGRSGYRKQATFLCITMKSANKILTRETLRGGGGSYLRYHKTYYFSMQFLTVVIKL